MKNAELIDATRQVALMARLGVPLNEGLKSMGQSTPVLARIAHDLEKGDSLARAVERHPAVFSPFYVTMVGAAEGLERPAATLDELSRWLEDADRLRRQVGNALFYPWLVLNMLFLEVALFAGWVLPQALLPLSRVAGVPWLARLNGPALAGAMPLGLVLVDLVALFVRPRLPGWRELRDVSEQALWARGLAALLTAGVSLPEALARAPGKRLDPDALRRGGTLTQLATGLDPLLGWAIAAGEEREELAPLLLEASRELEDEVGRRSATALLRVQPVALALVAGLVVLGLLAFWWPYYSMVVRIEP